MTSLNQLFFTTGILFLCDGLLILFSKTYFNRWNKQALKTDFKIMSEKDQYYYNRYRRGVGEVFIGLVFIILFGSFLLGFRGIFYGV